MTIEKEVKEGGNKMTIEQEVKKILERHRDFRKFTTQEATAKICELVGGRLEDAEKDYKDMRAFQAKFIQADQQLRQAEKRYREALEENQILHLLL